MASARLQKIGRECEERADRTQLGEGHGGGMSMSQRESRMALEPVMCGVEEVG